MKWWQELGINPRRLPWFEGLLMKAKWLLKYGKVVKLGPDVWRVKNHTVIRRPDGTFVCDCLGYRKRFSTRFCYCSHILAVQISEAAIEKKRKSGLFLDKQTMLF